MALNQLFSEYPVTASLTAADTYTSEAPLEDLKGMIEISGTFVATVSVQYRRPGETTWRTMQTYTAATLQNVELLARMELRVGIETGNYTSGTVNIAIYEA